ncbi:hypothetical protein KCU95_g4283, partial [Aureobasidium melanogenum]
MTAYLNESDDEELAEEDMADMDWLNPTEQKINTPNQTHFEVKNARLETASKKPPVPASPQPDKQSKPTAAPTSRREGGEQVGDSTQPMLKTLGAASESLTCCPSSIALSASYLPGQ